MAPDSSVLAQPFAPAPYSPLGFRPHACPDGIHRAACPTRRHPVTADPSEEDRAGEHLEGEVEVGIGCELTSGLRHLEQRAPVGAARSDYPLPVHGERRRVLAGPDQPADHLETGFGEPRVELLQERDEGTTWITR